MSGFLNPYGFLPFPRERPQPGHDLGDGDGPGHDRWDKDLWSGSIPIRITTVTPMLVLDQSSGDVPSEVGLKSQADVCAVY